MIHKRTALVQITDVEGVIIVPHYYLYNVKSPDEIDRTVLNLLKKRGKMTTSQLWKELNCHLWEISSSLLRLKESGFLKESER